MRVDTSTAVVVVKLDGHGALGLVRSLGRVGVPVYGFERSAAAPALRSRYLRGWRRHDFDREPVARSVEELVDFARAIGGHPVLIPTDDAGALLVDAHAEELASVYRLPRRPPGLAAELYSKQGMYHLCQRLGVATPEADFPRSRDDVVAWLEREPPFPVVLKPIAANRGHSLVLVRDAGELLAAYDRLEAPGSEPRYMLQEYVPGGAEAVWMFDGYCDRRGDCVIGFTGRKLRQRPRDGGITSLGVCTPNEHVEAQSKAFLHAVGYRGAVDMDWLLDGRTGSYALLDVNPRLGWTFRLFVGPEGMDVARAMYLDLTDQPVPAATAPWGRKWVVEDLDLATAASDWRDGRLRIRDWLASVRGVEEAAWFARDDPRPFLGLARRRAARLVLRRRGATPQASPRDEAGSA